MCNNRELIQLEIAKHNHQAAITTPITQPLRILPHAPPHFTPSIKLKGSDNKEGSNAQSIGKGKKQSSSSSEEEDAIKQIVLR